MSLMTAPVTSLARPPVRFLTRQEVIEFFEGKRVAVVGSGPGVLDNAAGFIDGHDVVVRINNYKFAATTGRRTDCFYSFFGGSIRKTAEELRHDGVKLCICKCPDAQPIESDWHRRRGKMIGVDFRPHYQRRRDWWFCDTYIPTVDEFMVTFKLLGKHMPTTGFAAIYDVLLSAPAEVYLTGFDFFRSRVHNVNEAWWPTNRDDPIKHEPESELAWLAANLDRYPITVDAVLAHALKTARHAA